MQDMAREHQHNRNQLEEKAKQVGFALVLTAVEVLLLALGTLVF